MLNRNCKWVAVGAVFLADDRCRASEVSLPGAAATGWSRNRQRRRQKTLTVAVIPKSTGGEFWQTVEVGAKAAAKDLGVNIKWEGALVETEIADENKIIENMVNIGVDGIAMAPLNPKAMRKPVEAAVAAGIPVVVFDSELDGNAQHQLRRHRQQGRRSARCGRTSSTSSRGPEACHHASLHSRHGQHRKPGPRLLGCGSRSGPPGFGRRLYRGWPGIGGKKTAANVLEGFVKDGKLELDGIFCCNLNATQGMVAALDDLHKSGVTTNAVFVGFDSSPKLVEEMQHGDIDALVVQNPKKMGYLAVETLVKHLRGEKVEPRIDTGVELVTAERIKNEPEIRKLVGME